jgi:hypothetical protein
MKGMRWAGHLARMEEFTNAYIIGFKIIEGNRLVSKVKCG